MVPANQAPGQPVSVTPVISAPLVKSISVDGKKDDWQQIPVSVSGLTAPWNGAAKDRTRFSVCHDKKNLYFLYEVADTTIIYNNEKDRGFGWEQ